MIQRLTCKAVFLRHGRVVPPAAVREAARWQSSLRPDTRKKAEEEEVLTSFPGNELSGAAAMPRRRHRSQRSREADGLLAEIFNLEKQVAAEQQRQRLSVRASKLGQAPVERATKRKRDPPSAALTAEMMESEGVFMPEAPDTATTAVAGATSAAAPSPPELSIPTPEETARAASRARHFSSEAAAFAASASLPAPPLPAASPTLPPQSWAPSFAFTAEQLRSSMEDGMASEVAFTLEELEDTLFSPAVEPEKAATTTTTGATADVVGLSSSSATSPDVAAVAATTAPPSPSPPPSPPPPQPAAPSAAPSATSEAKASEPAAVDASVVHTSKGASLLPKKSAGLTEAEPQASASLSHATERPSAPLAMASSDRKSKASATSQLGAASTAPTAPAAAPRPPLPPLLKCRLRGVAVVEVVMLRAASSVRELVESLHEAVTFAESLPPLERHGVREVRLRVDTSAPECANAAFLGVHDVLEIALGTEEYAEVQRTKERLLRRIQDGHCKQLRFMAQVQVCSTTAAPAVLRNFAAELLLSCAVHEVRHVAQPNVRPDGDDKNAVRLSFSGIGVGVFPVPATVRRVRELVGTLCEREEQRARLLTYLEQNGGGRENSSETFDVNRVAANTLLCLHLLPTDVSTALLSARGTEDESSLTSDSAAKPAPWCAIGGVTTRVKAFVASLSQQWSAVHRAVKQNSEGSLAACITTAQVWSWMCEVVLQQPGLTDAEATLDAMVRAARAAPLRRCRRCYARFTAPFLSIPSTSTPKAAVLHFSFSSSVPFVVEVTSSTLAHTSVADLASEIREQPSDVVLAIASTVSLQQRLKFLASLHLTDTGAHHNVTVLLSGAPQEVDECASLTRSSARLVTLSPDSVDGPTTTGMCEPSWLHAAVEVSAARSFHAAAAEEVTAAVQYVTRQWRRPCVVSAKSDVGLLLQKAAAAAEKHAAKRQGPLTEGAMSKSGKEQLLSPLLVLGSDVPDVVKKAARTRCGGVSSLTPGAETAAPKLGLAFLAVLDAACSALCREAGTLSTEDVNVVSIAALQLDMSAGGVFDAADRVSGDGVESVLSAMEEEAAAMTADAPSLQFASLPLLRWMVKERLLFYQLNGSALSRFARWQSK